MGKIAFTVVGALFLAVGVWILATDGDAFFGWGAVALGLGFDLTGILLILRGRSGFDT